ncbi:MAG: Nramp family divalent metal transporter [Solirubrobacterales bacterium]
MSNSQAIQDYAKAVYVLGLDREGLVPNGEVAARIGVTPATATTMLRKLADLGLARYVPYKGAGLTPAGERVALEMIRHHRLIEAFLAETLGMPAERVHDEAEVLEHYISEDLEALIAAKLGEPSHDPHGQSDPWPRPGAAGAGGAVTPPATRSEAEQALPGEAAVAAAAHRSLHGEARGLSRIWPFLGPAFVAAVAYIDPGNFATNVSGGAKFGYLLLWVVLAANLIAMLVQAQSAKLGIATGKNLAELCRERFSHRTSIVLWIQAEIVAMACDLAEIVGASLGLNLLFGIPLFLAGLITGAATFTLLALQRRGFRKLEAAITALVGVVVISFAYELFNANPDGSEIARHLFVPAFDGTESILLATGIVGATVMPHVIYLHSALTQHRIVGRDDEERRRILRFEKVDVIIALALAGLVNLAMMVVAAALFHGGGLSGIETIEGAFEGLRRLDSQGAATIFGIALLASGFASSSVGTMAGQVVMQGFIHRRIPLFLRRALTLTPALVVLAIGVNPTDALVGSQVVLSFGIPFALVPLVLIASRREVMGDLVNPRWLTALAALLAGLIIALNVFLLVDFAIG